MPRSITTELPLRDLRRAANISEQEMAEFLSSRLDRPISSAYVRLLERRGTRNIDYLAAYAEITEKPLAVVSAAAKSH